jgi:hypothetical protein
METISSVLTVQDIAALETIAAQLENPHLTETERSHLQEASDSIVARYSCDCRLWE